MAISTPSISLATTLLGLERFNSLDHLLGLDTEAIQSDSLELRFIPSLLAL